MDNANARAEEQALAPETPEDVAILYSWANLPGAKYRDFSASRREYRAQQRAKVAEAQRQAELKAARELEETAQREVDDAQRQLEETRKAEAKAAADAAQAAEDERAKRHAEEMLRRAEERAEQERQEAFRRQQSAEELRVLAERAQEEMLQARKRAEEQAARYAEADAQPVQVREQARVLPGETSDPYYYTGPVDPAYFASTPGVRTAQAARTSTERKAYVYPMHPGSDEYDSGTIGGYRGNNQFAPSPSPAGESAPSPQTQLEQRSPEPKEPESAPHVEEDSDPAYAPDDDYYDGGRATRLFTPMRRGRYTEALETAQADLHIRPASRVSGDHEQHTRTFRPSPMPQGSFQANDDPSPVPGGPLPEPEAELAPTYFQPVVSTPASYKPAPEPQAAESASPFRPVQSGPPRESQPIRAEKPGKLTETVRQTRNPFEGVEPASPGQLEPIRHEEPDDAGTDNRSSRMFIPSPRRRVLQLEGVVPPSFRQSAEQALHHARSRDEAALEGHRVAHTEVESREAQDRFVREQPRAEDVTGAAREEEFPATEKPGATQTEVATASRTEDPVHWRSLNRTGESGFRRRRQPGREAVARTARQPRSSQEQDLAADAQTGGEPSEPPAWLSSERPAHPPAQEAKLDLETALPDLPAAPGDPAVPAPRPVLRRQPSGLRPRVRANAASSSAADLPVAAPATPAAERAAPEDWRTQGAPPADPAAPASDTLQQSRERVASRWFALSGLMGAEGRTSAEPRVGTRSAASPAPMLCVLSISGGVGKTSIVATLGRALSSLGEKVLLADTSVHGILPYFFGAREQRPGAVRTFSPPPGSSDAPVLLVSYDADGRGYDETGQARVLDDLYRRSNDVERVLVDAGVNSAWLARTIAGTNPWVLVPVAPDMNSVIGTQSVERLFQDVKGQDGRPVKPYYVLNQYDPTIPLHLDVREVLRQFLGDRLLPIMLHRTPAVSEALAEGMTIIDYAPRAPIANDYMNLATWVRHLADPGTSFARPTRWSER